ncbi:hypothetical protein SAMD00019534_102450, partial [Acytostelium subglobosum LB1]|uniref:hypothetical protein n=1 Tax=Acytostelium subglobosum LB1 TaxID=1410327 RepID=UPI000644832B
YLYYIITTTSSIITTTHITMRIIAAFVLLMVAAVMACEPFYQPRNTPLVTPDMLTRQERLFHEKYMQIAYDLAIAQNNLFTSVITHPNGTIMCLGLNDFPTSSILHGEISAMLNCSRIHHKNTWEGYYLYTTGESCPMCHSAAMWMGFAKIIYGTSIQTLYCDKCLGQIPILSNTINANAYGLSGNNAPMQIIGGILAQKTDTIYPNFCSEFTHPWHTNPICTSCAAYPDR